MSLITKRMLTCLACDDGRFEIEHLLGPGERQWGPWYCKDCGEGHRGVAGNDEVRIYELTGDRLDKPMVLLKLEDLPGDVFLVVRGFYRARQHDGKPVPEGEPFVDDGQRYYYDEHTCPTNYMREVVEILVVTPDGQPDSDPHGIFQYVSSRHGYDGDTFDDDDLVGRLAAFGITGEGL